MFYFNNNDTFGYSSLWPDDSTEMANYRSVTKLSTSMASDCVASTSKKLDTCCAALPVKRTLSSLETIVHRQALHLSPWCPNRQLSGHCRRHRRYLHRLYRHRTIGPASGPICLRSTCRPALVYAAITALTRNCRPCGNVSIIRRCPSPVATTTRNPTMSVFRIPSIPALLHQRHLHSWERGNNCRLADVKVMPPFRDWWCRRLRYPAGIESTADRLNCAVLAHFPRPFVKWHFQKDRAKRVWDSASSEVVIRQKDRWESSLKRKF